MRNHRLTLAEFRVIPRLAALSLVAVLSCHVEPKARAAQDESAVDGATRAQPTQTDPTLDDRAGDWSGAAAPDVNESTDGLTPAEQWDAARHETSEAFRYTGHVLDSALDNQG